MSDLHFQTFGAAHLHEAGALCAVCFNSPPWNDGWTAESASTRLAALLAFPTSVGCVVSRQERLLGLALGHLEPWTDGLHFYLSELCIDPKGQRRGVGAALLADLMRRLGEYGIRIVYLPTEPASGAEPFFREQQFQDDALALKLWRDI